MNRLSYKLCGSLSQACSKPLHIVSSRSAAISSSWLGLLRDATTSRVVRRSTKTDQPKPLLPEIAAGKPGAVEACVDRYGPGIWAQVRRSCRNHAEAEDVCQDIFVDIWRHAERYDASLASEWTFVMTITRRRLIDGFRRAGRRLKPLGDGESAMAGVSCGKAGPDEVALVSEDARLAVRGLNHLSEIQRHVLEESIFAGKKYPEIAQELELPLGTVKTHARRGLIKLRKHLGGDDVAE
jgi:RNA polymerase sigma-70 factor (ECF subfamily)